MVENAYERAVWDGGNPAAKEMLADVFESTDAAYYLYRRLETPVEAVSSVG